MTTPVVTPGSAPSAENCTSRGSPEPNLIGSPGTCEPFATFRGWAKDPNHAQPVRAIARVQRTSDGGAVLELDGGIDVRDRPRHARVYLSPEVVRAIGGAP